MCALLEPLLATTMNPLQNPAKKKRNISGGQRLQDVIVPRPCHSRPTSFTPLRFRIPSLPLTFISLPPPSFRHFLDYDFLLFLHSALSRNISSRSSSKSGERRARKMNGLHKMSVFPIGDALLLGFDGRPPAAATFATRRTT